jgi:hypothetical protein
VAPVRMVDQARLSRAATTLPNIPFFIVIFHDPGGANIFIALVAHL